MRGCAAAVHGWRINKKERSQLSIIKRIFSALEPEHREAMVDAIQQRPRPRRPNSEDAGSFNIDRHMASNRSVATRNMDELIGMCRMVLADGVVEDSEAKLLAPCMSSRGLSLAASACRAG
jgi:hypothetical protein